METSGFVQDKLTEWGFSEFIQRFKGMSLLLLLMGIVVSVMALKQHRNLLIKKSVWIFL